MGLKRCDQGHFYATSMHTTCPHCGIAALGASFAASDAGISPRAELRTEDPPLSFCTFCAARFTGGEQTRWIDGREVVACLKCGEDTRRGKAGETLLICPHCSSFIAWPHGSYCPFCGQQHDSSFARPSVERDGTTSMPAAASQGRPADPDTLAPGTLLGGRYRLGDLLRRGVSGHTYLAWDERLRLRVVVKEFFHWELFQRGRDGLTVSPHFGIGSAADGLILAADALEEFLSDARRLARLDHPCIVRVRDVLEETGTGYLVTNYYEGESLALLLERQPDERLGPDRAVAIMTAVLNGLRVAHAYGVVHGDVQPDNIHISWDGERVILLGFSAARRKLEMNPGLDTVVLSDVCREPEFFGRRGSVRRLNPTADVYACAAALYRMVTGRLPPDAPSRIMEDTLRPPHELNPAVSPRLSEALQRCMALKPEERPQSAEEFQQLLHGERRTPPLPPQ
jgi:hypothetical protein